jgi:LmbE family N-acetylglucosaminyl deacetylase
VPVRDRHHRDTGPLDPQRASVLVEHVCLDPGGTPARTLLIVAHPGGETIGASWLLAQLPDVQVLHVTDGAPIVGDDHRRAGCATALEYAGLRRAELLAAMALAEIAPAQCARLGLTDGQVWRDLETCVWGVVDAFMTWTPDLILTHPYEGGHPDHDATAFAVHTAVRLLARMHLPVPAVAEFTSYHRGGDTGLVTGAFLDTDPQAVIAVELGVDDRQRKRAMLHAFASQRRVLEAFAVGTELYRAAPRYDFTRPPHDGPLFYETQPSAVAGSEWRVRAAAAVATLNAAVTGVPAGARAARSPRSGVTGRGRTAARAC